MKIRIWRVFSERESVRDQEPVREYEKKKFGRGNHAPTWTKKLTRNSSESRVRTNSQGRGGVPPPARVRSLETTNFPFSARSWVFRSIGPLIPKHSRKVITAAQINFLSHPAPGNDFISFLKGFFSFPGSKHEWYYLNERYRDTHWYQWTTDSDSVVGQERNRWWENSGICSDRVWAVGCGLWCYNLPSTFAV